MLFQELLKNRRSVRHYRDKAVPEDTIRQIIRESTLAPNAGNEQPWKFVIVNNMEMMKRISDESKQNILARIAANPADPAKQYRAVLEKASYNVFYNAPCLVIILGQAGLKNLFVDCALAGSYFMMAAAARGLGTCWINLGMEIKDPAMRGELGITDDLQIVAPIILGYPTKIPPVPGRREPDILRVIS